LLLVLLLVPLWIFVGRAVLTPLRVLGEAIDRMVPGADGAVIPVEAFPRNELGRVMAGWNEVLRRLGEQSARVAQSWEAVRRVFGSMAAAPAGEEHVLQVAIEVLTRAVGARYGAMHLLDEQGKTVAFLNTGLDEEEQRRLAGTEPPRGLGLLGVLQEGQVIRLDDLTRDARHRGFPEGHPPMRSFLGAPIAARGKVYGRVYLTEKLGGAPFSEEDERLVLTMAQSVALAVESMRAARRVHAVERLSRRVLASLPDAVMVLGRGGRVRYANRVFYDWFGGEPAAVVGRALGEVLPLAQAARQIEEIAAGSARANPFEAAWRSEGGEERTFRVTVSGLRVAEEEEEEEEELVIFEELTAYRRMAERQRELEAQLLQAEKLSALGVLVSGVAHELNNPLAVVLGRAQLLLRGELDERTRRALETVQIQADRMKRIIQHLLTVARKSPPERRWVDLNALLRETVELRVYQMRVNNIEVRWDLDGALPQIFADPHQLGQVFLNLVTNAEQAMAGRSGTLTIGTERIGEAIRVRVADTGSGIAPEHLPRIFDPFFTTKPVGRGTGLGLSVSYGIVAGHGGRIWAESRPGHGAVFFVELPLVTEGPAESAEGPPVPVPSAIGGRDILLVDDEAEVRDVLTELLELDGHRVEAVGSGEEALARLRRRNYDVILTDIRMPGLDGRTLCRRLADEQPALLRRVIFVTGDTANAETQALLQETRRPHVAKPVTLESLREAVARACAARGAGDSP
jgi:two-component system NtrC family sensor kinase